MNHRKLYPGRCKYVNDCNFISLKNDETLFNSAHNPNTKQTFLNILKENVIDKRRKNIIAIFEKR